jgi:HPt (histidine-containing phosphotransfer) domain-containing protein
VAAYASVTEPILAREIFDRLRQATLTRPEVLGELCRDYLGEAHNAIARMREALAQADAEVLRERAHYLKGSSMMIGARELTQCCASLERMGRDSELHAAAPELERARAALQAVQAELSQELGAGVLPKEGSAA